MITISIMAIIKMNEKITFHFIFQDINIFYDYFIATNQRIFSGW